MSVSHSLSMHLISRSCEFCLKETKTANQPQKGNILQFKHSRTCVFLSHLHPSPSQSIPAPARQELAHIQGSCYPMPLEDTFGVMVEMSGTSGTALPGPSASTPSTWTPAIPSCVRSTLWNSCPGCCHLLRCCRDFSSHRATDSERLSQGVITPKNKLKY